jgi:hypothetical protein
MFLTARSANAIAPVPALLESEEKIKVTGGGAVNPDPPEHRMA